MDYKERLLDTMMRDDATIRRMKDLMWDYGLAKVLINGSCDDSLDYLRNATEARMNFHNDILDGEGYVAINRPFCAAKYAEFMGSVVLGFNIEDLRGNVSAKEIFENKLDKDVEFDDKRFRRGSRYTKFLDYVASKGRGWFLKDRIVGNLKPQSDDDIEVYLNASQYAVLAAGWEGDSCLSPGGENGGATPAAMGYLNMLVAHDAWMNWRAWVFVDHKKKVFTVHSGYPREDYRNQMAVHEFFYERGYKVAIHRGYFFTPEYMDTSRLLGSYNYNEVDQARADFAAAGIKFPYEVDLFTESKVYEDKIFHFLGDNRDAELHWINGFGFKGSMNLIVDVGHCDSCGRLEVGMDSGLCEGCQNSMIYCDTCGDHEYEENVYYLEDSGENICEHCAREAIDKYRGTIRAEKTLRAVFEALDEKYKRDGDFVEYYESLESYDRLERRMITDIVYEKGLADELSYALRRDDRFMSLFTEDEPYDLGSTLQELWYDTISEKWEYSWVEGEARV